MAQQETLLKVYGNYPSPYARVVLACLEATNTPYEMVNVSVQKREHHTESFLALNPKRQIPVLEDNGFVLTESLAILRYLCSRFPTASQLYPSELRQRARVDEFLELVNSTVGIQTRTIIFNEVIGPLLGRTVNLDEAKKAREQLESSLRYVNEYYCQETPLHLIGASDTLADIVLPIFLMSLERAVGYSFSAFPRVHSYLQHAKSLPHHRKLLEKFLEASSGTKPT